MTWDATVDLCDRGVPFIVDTIQATSAHAQAIVGYDLRRGTLFIRDPYLPTLVEVLAVQFFEQYAAHGPRGFAVVPAEQAARLHGLELPESELYANLERIEAALEVHDRASASAAASELQKQAPGHRLAILGRRALANYDENPFEQLAAADAGLVLFPGEPTWLLQRLSALRANSSSARVAQELEAIHADDSAHPVFRELLAAELSGDARELPRAMRLLRRVARQLRDRSATLTALAECHWTLREFEHSLGLYRLAATLDTTSERAATAFFRANLSLGRAPEGIRFLERRAEQSRKRSSSPDITLFCALEQTDQSVRAFEVLQMALAARPQDGALCRFAARAEARYGNLEHAQELLQRAEPVSPRSEWLRSVAEVAACAGDGDLALQSWREVATLEPLATDAHAAVAQRLLIGHGPDAARDYLVELAARFPENVALQTLLAEHLSGSDPNHALTALEHLVALEPAHAWAHRELALTLSKLKSFERARQHAQQALALEPSNPSGPLVLGRVAEFSGDREGARAQYQRAMQLDADSGLALSAVVGMLGGSGEVVALLEDCYDRVLRESRTGDGVFAWFSAALGHFEPIELARRAKNARIQRADLFASWCVGADTSYGTRPAAAVAVAKEMTERFPLLPGAWLGLARASDASGQESKSVAALERAIEINPAFLPPTLDLCTVLERRADMVGALHVLDRALRHAPLDVTLLVQKASLLKRVGRRDEALATLRSAIDADPRAPAPWELLTELADAATAVKLIANVLEHRAWDTDAWLRFAQAKAQNDVDGALVALDRAIELEPHRVEAHDLRVMIAARTGRRSQALEACRPEHFGEDVPAELRGREAWVWAQFGEVQRAIVLMDAVLEDYPDYAWGHQQLADWAEATDDGPRELRAAEALARLHARSAIARGYLASALEKAGKPR
ncbi:MAG TPA: hypothetical protein PKA88_14210, partial [Polyangiaceae bacterium]|nr:hypothetical protein [Polyangiaceae bacterium]